MQGFESFYYLTQYKFLLERIKLSNGDIGNSIIYPVNGFGANHDVGMAVEDVWDQGGTQTLMTTAAEIFASSSDALDTDINITLIYLDNLWDLQEVTINFTSGQSQQTFGGSITMIRILSGYISGGTAAVGDIYISETDTLTDGVPDTVTKIHGKIEIEYQETGMALYSIPRNFTGFLFDLQISASFETSEKTQHADLYVREFEKVFRKKWGVHLRGNNKPKDYKFPIKLPPKSDMKITAESESAGGLIEADFTLLVLANGSFKLTPP